MTNAPDLPSPDVTSDGDQRVTLMDRGLQMPRGTQVIPRGWRLMQEIATDPSTGGMARYRVDYSGPNGEGIRGLGSVNYGSFTGMTFDQAWQQIIAQGLQGDFGDLSLGGLRRSTALDGVRDFQTAIWNAEQSGMQVHVLEAPLSATLQGRRMDGLALIVVFSSPQFPDAGTLQATVLLAPAGRLGDLVRINEQIANSFQPNPPFEQVSQQLAQGAMQRSQAAHDQRMAASRAQFDAHQQMMQDRYATNDRMYAQWMDSFRGSPAAGNGGSGYTGHEYYIDGIYERSTFQDPYSGQQVHRDGQYDYWYTNGLGEYHGTNDPNFNPRSLNGTWQRIEPLRPDY